MSSGRRSDGGLGELVDPEMLMVLVSALEQVDELDRRRAAAQNRASSRGSRASHDARVPESQYVLVVASGSLGVAIDHLRAWRLLVHGGLHPTFAQMTLVRAALEGAVTARWLLDGSASSADRVARGVAAALEDYDERRKFEVAARSPMPDPGSGAKTAAERTADLRAARDAAGLPVVRLPPATRLMELYGRADGASVWLYRLASAFAHGRQWALAGTDRVPHSPGPGLPRGAQAGFVSSSDQVVAYATAEAVRLVEAAVRDLEAYRSAGSIRTWLRG